MANFNAFLEEGGPGISDFDPLQLLRLNCQKLLALSLEGRNLRSDQFTHAAEKLLVIFAYDFETNMK